MKPTLALLAIAGLAAPVFAQSGPAILSRGEAPSALTEQQVSFRPFVEFSGIYYSGLSGVGVNSQGNAASDASIGVELTAGVSGSHSWKKTRIGLDYRGSFNHFGKNSYYDGSQQLLMLGLTHQLSRHTVFSLRETAGTFTRSFGLLGLPQTIAYDPSQSNIPTTDFFDNRTFYLSTQANLTFQKSARLSFNIGGDAYLTRRRSTALYGMTGATARGDTQYRLSRRSTIGAGYTFTHYAYTGVYSSTDLHGATVSYSIQITKTLEFSSYAGFMRAETKFLQSVPLDPAIAALIGRTSAILAVHRIDYVPNIGARLARTFRRGVADISGGHTVTPGNGLFLTSTATNVSAGYTYTGLRLWSFNAQAGYNNAKSVGNILGNYGDTSGGLSVARRIMPSLNVVGSFTARQYNSPDFNKYNRLIYNASLGIGFTPGDVPLRLW